MNNLLVSEIVKREHISRLPSVSCLLPKIFLARFGPPISCLTYNTCDREAQEARAIMCVYNIRIQWTSARKCLKKNCAQPAQIRLVNFHWLMFNICSRLKLSTDPSLSYLHIRYNGLTALREYDLSGLENLKQLMLHSNSIHSIEDRSFQDLRSLQVIWWLDVEVKTSCLHLHGQVPHLWKEHTKKECAT